MAEETHRAISITVRLKLPAGMTDNQVANLLEPVVRRVTTGMAGEVLEFTIDPEDLEVEDEYEAIERDRTAKVQARNQFISQLREQGHGDHDIVAALRQYDLEHPL